MTKFDYESCYRKIMDESINNIRKMDRLAQQTTNKMKEEINTRIKEVQTK